MDLSFAAVVPTVYKREDYKRTKHDTVFSNWKVLIGSDDWEDFKKGKEGVGRYRVQNLPSRSCPGLYELGVVVAVTGNDDDQKARNLDSYDVLAAYLGQAESVRSRLQCYGRSGAHLHNVNGCESPDKKAMFEDIFMKGGSVVYRWAPMGSKREAEATEGMLLSTFDYAWNKGSNGERRHLDLLNKLGDLEFVRNRKSRVSRVLFPFLRNQVKEERKLSCDDDEKKKKKESSTNFFTSIIKLSRSRPQLVSDKPDEISSGSVCGVVLENGDCCSTSPVKGRKRCLEHKGQRICRVSPVKQQPSRQDYKHQDTDLAVVNCGVILPNMEPCTKRPVPGRKRCEDHKGMRINAFLFLLNREDREKTVKDENNIVEEEGEASKPRFCEAMTKKGVPCTRSSPRGSKRCWQHKEK